MSKLLIFDADSIIFTVAWKFRTKKATNLVKINTNKFITDVLTNVNADDYIGFYGDKSEDNTIKPNFRYAVDPNYKVNRPPTPDFIIKWRPIIHDIFKNDWGFLPVQGMEADDAVAMTVNKYKDKYDEIIVATFDKDLKQIPNITFYNMKTHKTELISKNIACRNFYTQMLMGDSGDNIPGLKGIGKVGAKKILKDCTTTYSLFRTTVKKYKSINDDIYKEELKTIYNTIVEDLKNSNEAMSTSKYADLSIPKLKRQIRIDYKKSINEKIEKVLPGGWKVYYKQQYKLLKLLTEENEDIVIPEIQKNPIKKEENESEIDIDKMDDFLTV